MKRLLSYFNGRHLKKLRNRTYFESFDRDGSFSSEGAWRISVYNLGEKDITLIDGGGQEFLFPGGGGVPAISDMGAVLLLDGSPEIVRDDIIEFKFAAGIGLSLMQVQFDRIVPVSGDQIEYPVNEYDQI